MELSPVHPRLPVVHCRRRHNRLEDVVRVDVLVGVEEAHADVLLLVVARILVPFQLQVAVSDN